MALDEAGGTHIEALIQAFVEDAASSSLELPRLTTGQRKQARKVVDAHVGLKCETCGLAADRRLRVIKGEEPRSASDGSSEVGDAQLADLDVEAAIANFVADMSRDVLELPRLTTGQRKQARKVAEQHFHLACESYGFGLDRRLHLVKRAAGEKDCGELTCGLALKLPRASAEHAAAVEEQLLGECSSSASTCTSGRGSGPFGSLDSLSTSAATASAAPALRRRSPSASPADSLGGQLPVGVQVRNTFLVCGEDDEPKTDRLTQSMPHGMFRRLLLAELELDVIRRAVTPEPDFLHHSVAAPVIAAPASPPTAWAPGTEVVIEGLMKCPAFNGKQGTVQSLDEQTGRYDILLRASSKSGGLQWAKVRGEHLRLVVAEPPCFAPTLVDVPATPSGDAAARGQAQVEALPWIGAAVEQPQLQVYAQPMAPGGYADGYQSWGGWEGNAYGEVYCDQSYGVDANYYMLQMSGYCWVNGPRKSAKGPATNVCDIQSGDLV